MNEEGPQLLKSHWHLPAPAEPHHPQLPVWARHPAVCRQAPAVISSWSQVPESGFLPNPATPVGGFLPGVPRPSKLKQNNQIAKMKAHGRRWRRLGMPGGSYSLARTPECRWKKE